MSKLHKSPDNKKLLMELGSLFIDAGLVDTLFKQTQSLGNSSTTSSSSALAALFADGLKHVKNDGRLADNYFASARQHLIESSLKADGGKAILRSFIDVLGVNPFIKIASDDTVCDAFFADMRSQKIAKLFTNSLRANPGAIEYLQQQLPAHVDLQKIVWKEDGNTENIFDVIVNNRAHKAFFKMVEDFDFGGSLMNAATSEGGSLSFMDFLLNNSAVIKDQQLTSGMFDLPLLGNMVRQGHGATALADLFHKGGVRVIDDIVHSGGGVKILDQAISSPFADLLLQRLIKEYSLGSFMKTATNSKPAMQMLRSFAGPDTSLEDILNHGHGQQLIDDVIEQGASGKLLKTLLQGEGAQTLTADVFKNAATRDILLQMLQEEGQQHQEAQDNDKALASAVLNLEQPIRSLHQVMWDAKMESGRKLTGAAIIDTEQDEGEELFAEMNSILVNDHYALQTFKKCYKLLLDRGLNEKAAEFFESYQQAYLSHDGLRDSLYEFMKSMKQDTFGLTQQLLANAHKNNKNDYYYLKELAAAALKEGRFDEVRAWSKKMVKINPDNGEAYNLMAISYKREGRLDKAIKWYQRGIAHDDNNAKLHFNLAIAYALVGEKRASNLSLQRSRQLQNLTKRAA